MCDTNYFFKAVIIILPSMDTAKDLNNFFFFALKSSNWLSLLLMPVNYV